MGYNTVVLILNDFAHILRESPHTLTWAITNPPFSGREVEMKSWWLEVESVAKDHGESMRNFRSGLQVLPTFHADENHIIFAGHNQLIQERSRYWNGKLDAGKVSLTVLAPEWWKR